LPPASPPAPTAWDPWASVSSPMVASWSATLLPRQERRSQKSKISGVLNGGGLEVTGNTGRPMIKGTHPALHTPAQGFLVVGQALLVAIAFEVVVQVLVGVHLRGMRRQIEHLDAPLVLLQPVVHRHRLVNLQVVHDQQDLSRRRLQQPVEEHDEQR